MAGILEDGPIRKMLREKGLLKGQQELEAKRAHGTEAWWVLPKHDFHERIPVENLEVGLKMLREKFAGYGIVIHIDQAWIF